MARPSLIALVSSCLFAHAAGAVQITESFTTSTSTGNGTTLGTCKQITVGTFSNGSVSVPGNGAATISTPVETDSAFLHSSSPLPSSGYTVAVTVSKISYPKYTLENGVTLLAIANTKPLPASDTWWDTYRMLAVEVSVDPADTNACPVYVNYWDASGIHTWNGTAWVAGGAGWVPVLTCSTTQTYLVSVEKSGGWYKISIRSGTTLLTEASVPVASVRAATVEHFVVGDRLTNYFKGSMEVQAIAMPAPQTCTADYGPGQPDSTPPKDSGPPDGPRPDRPRPDGPRADVPSTVPDGPVKDKAPKADQGTTSWDLYSPDLGAHGGGGESSSCDCDLGRRPSRGAPALTLLALVALLVGRRGRRAR